MGYINWFHIWYIFAVDTLFMFFFKFPSYHSYKRAHRTGYRRNWTINQVLLARWLTSARAYRIGGRKLCPSVCLYVKRYLLLQFCTDYNQTWINMIWAVAAKTLLSQIFHNWRRIEVNCVYISHCKWYRTSAGMPACIPNRRCCAGQCAGQ